MFLCASATGVKLRPMIVFGGIPGCDVHSELYTESVFDWESGHFTVQKNAYCDRFIMREWIDCVWKPELQGVAMLLLGSLKIHHMKEVKDHLQGECCTSVQFVPPGATGICQPMDVAVMKPFKDRCRQRYLERVAEQGFCGSASERRKRVSQAVLAAWAEIAPETIVNGFRKSKIFCIGPRDCDGRIALQPPPPDECEEKVEENEEREDA